MHIKIKINNNLSLKFIINENGISRFNDILLKYL